jgi:dTMP kinase
MNRGKLIVIEGLAAAGKTSLTQYLQKHSRDVTYLSQPPDEWRKNGAVRRYIEIGPTAEFTERDEIEFSLAARYRQQEREIVPSLTAGRPVVLHRYVYSLAAYYYAMRRELVDVVEAGSRRFIAPDIIIYIDIEPEESLQRLRARKKKYPAYMTTIEFARATKEYYLSRLDARTLVKIDANSWTDPAVLLSRVSAQLYPGVDLGRNPAPKRVLTLWNEFLYSEQGRRDQEHG